VHALSPYLHPEFGGFCPGSRLRRDLRIVAFSVLVGATAGAVGIIGLRAAYSPTILSSDVPDGDRTKGSVATAAAESNGKVNETIRTDGTTRSDLGNLASREAGEKKPPKGACPDARSGGDEVCSFFKPRRVHVRALNDGPDTARIALGRTVTPPESAPETAPALQTSLSPKTALDKPTSAARAQPKSDEARPQSISRGLLKKPQKTVRREKRQRNEWGNDYPERVDPWAARAENSAGTGGRVYAREASYGRRGFWGWSW
jgi:hypothetical protein